MKCFIALGSNLENPLKQVLNALEALKKLPETDFCRASSCYRSPALTLPYHTGGVPPEYVNCVAMLETALSPPALLAHLQAIEQQQGRVRAARWGDRTIDLDILLYGDLVMNTPQLTIPHAGLKQRAFVLYPLAEIAPDWKLPDGETVFSLMEKCSSGGVQVIGEKFL